MTEPKTLKELLELHPDWADLPIGIYTGGNGDLDMLGGRGSVYVDMRDEEDVVYEKWENGPVLVFSGN